MFENRIRTAIPAAAAAAVFLAGAPAAPGQQAVPVTELPRVEQERIAAEAEARVKDAHRLYAEGKTFVEDGEWKKAALRFEAAAERRGEGDMKTGKLYRKAANAYYFAGKTGRAVENFERAAESAMAFGDVNLAAESYLGAALVAHERDDTIRANENGWKAHRLSGAVGLEDDVREAILTSLIVDTSTEVALGDEEQR